MKIIYVTDHNSVSPLEIMGKEGRFIIVKDVQGISARVYLSESLKNLFTNYYRAPFSMDRLIGKKIIIEKDLMARWVIYDPEIHIPVFLRKNKPTLQIN